MGLDITAFNKARKLKKKELDEMNFDQYQVYMVRDLPNLLDGKPEGIYKGEEYFRFRAGSYVGYYLWRNELAKTFLHVEASEIWENPEKFAEAPFIELINFSDCDGAIGPKTSAKLAKDFQIGASIAEKELKDWHLEAYNNWQRAFEIAANDGWVVFH